MGKKRIIYFGLLLIVTVMVIVTSFSYSFLIKTNEYHGKLNVVAGTLDYELTSTLLTNNSITLNSNEKAKLNIKIKSVNTIDSKYELFYTTTNNGVEIGYTTNNDLPTGTINANSTKTVNVIIKNTTNTSATITFGVIGGFINNQLVNESGTSLVAYTGSYCEVALNTVYNFDYTGSEQEFDVPCKGNYRIETWGAQGGNSTDNAIGGYGGYSGGEISLALNQKVYINVGGKGVTATEIAKVFYGGYNGGGPAQRLTGGFDNSMGTGGGATHMALDSGVLSALSQHATDDRILIVSGGGGGSFYVNGGGSGGGIQGNDGLGDPGNATGGTQTAGGHDRNNWEAMFGGASGVQYAVGSIPDGTTFGGSGGGGGYYGGARGFYNNTTSAGGGSGYIGNSNLTNKYMYCYGCTEDGNESTKTISTTGSSSERDTTNCPNGYSSVPVSKCAKSGNGYARITYLGESSEEIKEAMGYLVLFDANGGSVGTPNKVVTSGSTYGTLPVPTRSGYTFKGWNGKNMFNYQEVIKNSLATLVTLNGVNAMSWVNTNTGDTLAFLTDFKPQTQYTLSGRIASNTANLAWIALNYSDSSYGGYLDNYIQAANTFYNFTLTSKANADLVRIGGIWHSGERMYLDINNFQVEEGNIATPFEPYYVTSSTNVTQNKNHTLRAIWEAN